MFVTFWSDPHSDCTGPRVRTRHWRLSTALYSASWWCCGNGTS